MKTKLIREKQHSVNQYGNSGGIIIKEYECMCKQGNIIEEFDDIPGFKNRTAYIDCSQCSKEYKIVNPGSSWTIEKK